MSAGAVAVAHLEIGVGVGGVEREWRATAGPAGVVLEDGDGSEEVAASVLATRLAAIVGIAPRPQRPVPEVVVVERRLLEQLLAAGDAIGAEEARARLDLPADAPDDLAGALGALGQAGCRRWRVAALGASGAPPRLEAVDGGLTGWWQILTGDDALVAIATSTSRLLWAQLTEAAAWVSRAGGCTT